MNREVKKRRKLNFQKIFNLISASFILACCIFYGGRLTKLYIENNKEIETKKLATDIMNNNKDNNNFININNVYYFSGKENNNYISYSNLIWRIIRINEDKSITAVLDNSITALAAGESTSFKDSFLNEWLNDQNQDYTGILENNLNNINNYLTKTSTCNDIVSDTKKIACDTTIDDYYITVPSINDYINTGSNESFMNNEEYFYLINYNKDKKAWYVDDTGNVSTSDKTDIMGIKPVITIKSTISSFTGDGTKDNPYAFETETGLFGSYFKLGNDIWRVYNVKGENLYLSLNSYVNINNEEVTYRYSSINYYHNDTVNGSLAYYLNHNYLNSLSYKNIIDENEFSNGIYSNITDFDYKQVIKKTVPTKVIPLSIGDIILNPILTNYYLSTGINENNYLMYTMTNDFKLYTKAGSSKQKIVPAIQINKDLIKKGNGTLQSPYEVE